MTHCSSSPSASQLDLRAVHLDLKGVPPTFERLMDLLAIFKAAHYNAILVEWEDMFPWQFDPRMRNTTAYSPAQVREFTARANELSIQLIPLVQSFGHAETLLSLPEYAGLREKPWICSDFNPLSQEGRRLITLMIDEVLSLMPHTQYFHLGCDEVWTLGSNSATRAFIQEQGVEALYLHHVEPLLDHLIAKGIRPVLWHDMLRTWEDPFLHRIAEKADICLWGYVGDPMHYGEHLNTSIVERFVRNGLTLWGAGAYKGADGEDADLPDFTARKCNTLGWVKLCSQYHVRRFIATAWSRYSTHRLQNEPIDAALDCLLAVGQMLVEGQWEAPDASAMLPTLETLGERERFETCRDTMQELSTRRIQAWERIRLLQGELSIARLDTRRSALGHTVASLERLHRQLNELSQTAQRVQQSLAGLIPTVWIDFYLQERLVPLHEQLITLAEQVRQLEPQAYEEAFGHTDLISCQRLCALRPNPAQADQTIR